MYLLLYVIKYITTCNKVNATIKQMGIKSPSHNSLSFLLKILFDISSYRGGFYYKGTFRINLEWKTYMPYIVGLFKMEFELVVVY